MQGFDVTALKMITVLNDVANDQSQYCHLVSLNLLSLECFCL